MKPSLMALWAACLVPACAPSWSHGEDEDIRESIVKIYASQNKPDYYNPWRMRGPRSGTGSGCVITGRRILTNAHVVGDQTFIMVRRYGEAKRYRAKVLSVSHTADLALLTVDDETFFDGVGLLALGELPRGQQEVVVYGFPLGGDTLSTTQGMVSRIEHQTYSHSSQRLLAGQIDAAINPGNSGGPVIMDGRVVGVVMQSMRQADNIGYMVPINVVRHFLEDIADGRYDGFPSLGTVEQPMENKDLKARYGVPEQVTGLLILEVLPGAPADGHIRVGDVLVSVDGHNVEDNGTVEFRPRERTSYEYFVQGHQVGDDIDLEVLREGELLRISVHLARPLEEDWLVRKEVFDVMPTYFVYGGAVFCPLTKDLLRAWGSNWYNTAPKHLIARLTGNQPEHEGEQVIVLLKVLAADVNQGYHNFANWIITKVNGEEILNLQDLVERIEHATGEFIVIESHIGQQMVLNREEAAAAHENILRTYRIDADRSEDLRAAAALPSSGL